MTTHGFMIAVDHELDGAELDRLFAAGGDDTAPEIVGGRTLIHFDRDAATLAEAVASALFTVTAAGLTVVGIEAPTGAVAA